MTMTLSDFYRYHDISIIRRKTEKPLRRAKATFLCERPQTTDSMVATVKQAGDKLLSLMREQAGEELQSSMREEQVQDPTSVDKALVLIATALSRQPGVHCALA